MEEIKEITVRIPAPGYDIKTALQEGWNSRYEIIELEARKTSLNATKDGLDAFYVGGHKDSWEALSRLVDTYAGVKRILTKEYNAQNVSNAWVKFYELIVRFKLVDERTTMAFFNAEYPGAFIFAFWHYIKTHKAELGDMEPRWFASSLAPKKDGDGVLGDKYGLHRHNPRNWLMSLEDAAAPSGDGDMTNTDNIISVAKFITEKGGAAIVSHDAGVGVGEKTDFNDQESTNMKIHEGCALADIFSLKIGGHFVAKQYTCFEPLTVNLIMIYAALFDEFYLTKPLSSRPMNSEIYLIGKGFKGVDKDVREILLAHLRNFTDAPILPPRCLGEVAHRDPIIAAIIEFSKQAFERQERVITANIALFHQYRAANQGEIRERLGAFAEAQSRKWVAEMSMRRMETADYLSSGKSAQTPRNRGGKPHKPIKWHARNY